MTGLSFIVTALLVMSVLNVLMVVLTLGVKVARTLGKRRRKARINRLESILNDSLVSGEIHPELLRLGGWDLDLLATLMVDYLSLLRGADRDQLVQLAEEAGLVRRYFSRLRSRGRWPKARAALNLGYFGGPEAVAPLTELLAHRDETLRAVTARDVGGDEVTADATEKSIVGVP